MEQLQQVACLAKNMGEEATKIVRANTLAELEAAHQESLGDAAVAKTKAKAKDKANTKVYDEDNEKVENVDIAAEMEADGPAPVVDDEDDGVVEYDDDDAGDDDGSSSEEAPKPEPEPEKPKAKAKETPAVVSMRPKAAGNKRRRNDDTEAAELRAGILGKIAEKEGCQELVEEAKRAKIEAEAAKVAWANEQSPQRALDAAVHAIVAAPSPSEITREIVTSLTQPFEDLTTDEMFSMACDAAERCLRDYGAPPDDHFNTQWVDSVAYLMKKDNNQPSRVKSASICKNLSECVQSLLENYKEDGKYVHPLGQRIETVASAMHTLTGYTTGKAPAATTCALSGATIAKGHATYNVHYLPEAGAADVMVFKSAAARESATALCKLANSYAHIIDLCKAIHGRDGPNPLMAYAGAAGAAVYFGMCHAYVQGTLLPAWAK